MYIVLRIRDADPFFVKARFYACMKIEIDTPVVCSIHPGADGEVNTVVCQLQNADRWCWIFQNTAFIVEDIFEYIAKQKMTPPRALAVTMQDITYFKELDQRSKDLLNKIQSLVKKGLKLKEKDKK